MKKPRKPLPPRTSPLRRKTRVRQVNAKRKAKESARANGTQEYRDWLHAQPCAVCGWEGATQEAHAKTDGIGRKANAHLTLPLCGPHRVRPAGIGIRFNLIVEGCHQIQHRCGTKELERRHSVNLLDLAAHTQYCFAAYVEGSRLATQRDRR